MPYRYDPADPSTPGKIKQDIPEFNFPCPDLDRLIVATVMIYDPHADLLKLFPGDFNRRKYEAARRSGFNLNSEGKFPEWLEDCLVGSNDKYNAAIVAFVTGFNIADLPAFIMYREVFFSEFRAAMSADNSVDKRKAMDNAEKARVQLMELEKKLFTGEETLNVRNALYVMAEKQKLNLRPEDMATSIENGTLSLPDFNYQ